MLIGIISMSLIAKVIMPTSSIGFMNRTLLLEILLVLGAQGRPSWWRMIIQLPRPHAKLHGKEA